MKTLYFVRKEIPPTNGYIIPKGYIVEILSREIYLDITDNGFKSVSKLKIINSPIKNNVVTDELSYYLIKIDLSFIENVLSGKVKTNYSNEYWGKVMVDII